MSTGYNNLLGAINDSIAADLEYINTSKDKLIKDMESCHLKLTSVCNTLIVLNDECFSLSHRMRNTKFEKTAEYDCFTSILNRARMCERDARVNKSKFSVFSQDYLDRLKEGFSSLENFKTVEDRIIHYTSLLLNKNKDFCSIAQGLANEVVLMKKIISITK